MPETNTIRKEEEKKDEPAEKAAPAPSPSPSPSPEAKMYKEKMAEMQSLVEKAVTALKAEHERNKVLETRLSKLEKAAPPEDVDDADAIPENKPGKKGGYNPAEPEEDNEPSPDAATKPVKSTTSTGGAFTKSDVEKLLADQKAALLKGQEEFLVKAKEEMVTVIKAQTPIPFGYSPDLAAYARGDVSGLVRKAIVADRENSGGPFSTGEGKFGWHSGAGDNSARQKSERMIGKMLYGG